ncbi:MAG: hypothetical protein HC834_04945, partial [Rhodospirillales bacterium]|nr:hypothetical protein [Rhodospirillales bacterium]
MVDPEGYAFWSTGQDCVNPGIDANYTRMENCVTGLPVEGEAEPPQPVDDVAVAEPRQSAHQVLMSSGYSKRSPGSWSCTAT